MAHADTVPPAPGAEDNASGVGTLVALAPGVAALQPRCDVWLVATGAEERIYTGQPDHLGASALVRRVRARRAGDLRWALSLDEVGRGRAMTIRSPARRRFERRLLAASAGTGLRDRLARRRRHGQLRPSRVRARRVHGREARRRPTTRCATRAPTSRRGCRRARSRACAGCSRRCSAAADAPYPGRACPRATRSTTRRTASGRCWPATCRTRSRRRTRASPARAGPSGSPAAP